jgi:hypothetical protein
VPAKIFCVTLDCHDPVELAGFWRTALAYDVDLGWADHGEVVLTDPGGTGPTLLFMKVPESKAVKNRMHLDLVPETRMETEVARLVAAGASELWTLQDPDGYEDPWIWTVMQDPEGNEFCVGEQVSDRPG